MHTKKIAAGLPKGNKWTTTPKGPVKNDESLPLVSLIKKKGFADNGREAKRIITSGKVLVDGKICKEPAYGLGIMDIVSIPLINKNYRISVSKNNIEVIEISQKDANIKLCKVSCKKILTGGKIQLNLHDGSNILYEKAIKVNDTIILSLPDRKVKEIIPFAVGNQALILFGRHRGKVGSIKEIAPGDASCKSLTTIDEFKTLTDYAFIVGTKKSLIE